MLCSGQYVIIELKSGRTKTSLSQGELAGKKNKILILKLYVINVLLGLKGKFSFSHFRKNLFSFSRKFLHFRENEIFVSARSNLMDFSFSRNFREVFAKIVVKTKISRNFAKIVPFSHDFRIFAKI
jgi:hypothetical protein